MISLYLLIVRNLQLFFYYACKCPIIQLIKIATYYYILKITMLAYMHNIMWLDIGKLTVMSYKAKSILSSQLIAILMHYPYKVSLPD